MKARPGRRALTPAEARRARLLAALSTELRWRAASADFTTFARECLIIERKDLPAGYGPFELLDHQVKMLHLLETQPAVMNLKARQLGISTLVLALMLYRALARPGFKGLVLNHTDDFAKVSVERLRSMYLMMPAWVRDRFPKPNDASGSLVWDFGGGVKSSIMAQPVTRKTGASATFDMVFFDEAGLAEYAAEAYATLKPTLDAILSSATMGGVLVVVSTARGSTNWFAQQWKRGLEFATVFFPWWASPYYSQAQYDRDLESATRKGELQEFYQERPSSPEEAFRMTGTGRFPHAPLPEDCEEYPYTGDFEDDGTGTYRFVPDEDGRWKVRNKPIPGRHYVLHVDPAQGRGRDFTVAMVLSRNEDGHPSLDAYWRANNVEQIAAAGELSAAGRAYGDGRREALLAVEDVNGNGGSLITTLRGDGYRNLYRYTPTNRSGTVRKRAVYGFPMNKAIKPGVIDLLAESLDTLDGIFPQLARELHSYVVKASGAMGADTTNDHDDTVMAAAGGLWVLTHGMRALPAPTGPAGDGSDDGAPDVFVMRLKDPMGTKPKAPRGRWWKET